MELFQRLPIPVGADLTPLLVPSFVPNSMKGWEEHQHSLTQLIRWAWGNNMKVEIPIFPDDSCWDHGIDAFLNDSPVDVKAFALTRPNPRWKTRTMDSSAYAGKKKNPHSLTEWLIFIPFYAPVSEWEAAPFSAWRNSKQYPKLGAPYFFNQDVYSFEVASSRIGTRLR